MNATVFAAVMEKSKSINGDHESTGAPFHRARRWEFSFAVDLPPLLATGRWRERGSGGIEA
jgi:hypothetical protein